jgi:hypothetical protein
LSDHADPTPATGSSHDQLVLVGNSFCPPVSHGADTSDMKDFLTNLTDDGPKTGKKDAKQKMLMTPGHKLIWSIFAKKEVPANICGYGPESFYMMTRTCTTYHFLHLNTPPPPPPPPLPFCCECLYFITVLSISVSLVASTACAFGFVKLFNKLTGLKIPCCELFFIFLILFPAPGAAATQGLANHHNSSINTNASTAMIAVDTVTSWAQLVTACNRTRANITLSPTFKMGVYTHEIDFRLECFTHGCLN